MAGDTEKTFSQREGRSPNPDGLSEFVVRAMVHHIAGHLVPHFSLAASDVGRERTESGGTRRIEAAFCADLDRVVERFPELADLARLHLADAITGVPLHAVEKGWWWATPEAGKSEVWHPPRPNSAFLADLWRTDGETADRIIADVAAGRLTKADFAALAKAQKPRWQAECDAAWAVIREGADPSVVAQATARFAMPLADSPEGALGNRAPVG
jgi:hypothetical protein